MAHEVARPVPWGSHRSAQHEGTPLKTIDLTVTRPDRRGPTHRGGRRVLAWGCGFMTLALACNEASAAALGGLVTSVGVFVALAALFAVKLSPLVPPVPSWPVGLGALTFGAGMLWVLRSRFMPRARGGAAALWPISALQRAKPADAVAREVPILPASLDREALLEVLRSRFVALQAAWDAGDTEVVRALTTPGMFDELRAERTRCARTDAPAVRTEVVTLNADLIGYEEWPEACVASVEFTGLIRESAEAGAVPFRELWLLTQSKPGRGDWCLARHQALL